jgi:Ca2+-binding RTX toxin-like protein
MLGRMALVAAAALIVFPMSATGELQPSDISKGGVSGSTPRIASDGAAGIVAVWREVDGDTSAIRAAFRSAGGSWSASERISTPAARRPSRQSWPWTSSETRLRSGSGRTATTASCKPPSGRPAAGSDRLFGGDGSDRIVGGRGSDVLRGGLGSDVLRGNRGRDVLYGAAGRDAIDGGTGRDLVYGGIGADRIAGGRNVDQLFGGTGRDRIRGGRGSDVLMGGHGLDLLNGGSGNDRFRARDRGGDVVFGGSGLDFYSLDRWLDHARSIESKL